MQTDFSANILLDWYRKNRRDLPWRNYADPYVILISEVMLQQTQVSTVIPYFEKWIQRFPDFESLSKATEQEVFQYWQGLGYYRRAKMLHHLSKIVANNHIPVCYSDWIKLPGIGPYTAAAVSAIAYKQYEAAVDTNIRRVFQRVFYQQEHNLSDKDIVDLSKKMMRGHCPSEWNQAIMELGALICSSKNPKCEICPLFDKCCYASQIDCSERTKVDLPKITYQELPQIIYIPVYQKSIGFLKNNKSRWWKGLYVLPHEDQLYDSLPTDPEVFNLATKLQSLQISYSVTKYRVKAECCIYHFNEKIDEFIWVPFSRLLETPIPNPMRKLIMRFKNKNVYLF